MLEHCLLFQGLEGYLALAGRAAANQAKEAIIASYLSPPDALHTP
jgi:hypothetical protein